MKTKFFESYAFDGRVASIRNGFEMFDWVSAVPVQGVQTGSIPVFEDADVRPGIAKDIFQDIRGWKVLELGSLEGGHAYQLEQFGADVLAIESHPENYLKCLMVKNALNMKAKFLLGDFMGFLQNDSETYDLVFASGVLYHMSDPVELIRQIAMHSQNVFLWSHYQASAFSNPERVKHVKEVPEINFSCEYFSFSYDLSKGDRAYAGIESFCNRMKKEDIIEAFQAFGFVSCIEIDDDVDHPGGPAFTMVGSKQAGLFLES